jgi:hypothetical protein
MMKDLQGMVEKRRASASKRQKENYALARSLGFTSTEANALSQRSEKNIIKYAIEHGKTIE